MAETLAGDYEIVQEQVDQAWKANCIGAGTGYLSFQLYGLREQSIGLLRGVLRRAMAYLNPAARDITFDMVEKGVSFILQPILRGPVDLGCGIYCLSEGNILWLACWEAELPVEAFPQLPSNAWLEVAIPGEVSLENMWMFTIESVEPTEEVLRKVAGNEDTYQSWVDARSLPAKVILRAKQPGERFNPLGMAGKSTKINDLMVNLCVPRRARAKYPLVCGEDKVVWVPGLHLSHDARITDMTTKIYYMKIFRKE
jgi:tRNA(Ile)-lysidine synthase